MGWFMRCLIDEVVDEVVGGVVHEVVDGVVHEVVDEMVITMIIIISTLHILIGYEDSG